MCPAVDQALSILPQTDLLESVKSFLLTKQAAGVTPNTVRIYRSGLAHFRAWAEAQGITSPRHVTPDLIRRYLLHLAERRNPGGQHMAYRVLKTFFRWYAQEYEPEGWRDPMRRVQPPKLPQDPLPPLSLANLQKMLATCAGRNFVDCRDRAVLLCLLDTGCRASEFIALDLADVDLATGAVHVRRGKGGKSRVTFVGAQARKALLAYLRYRGNADGPLWVASDGHRLRFSGLRQIVRRRATKAGVPVPGLHAFRRAFAIGCLRGGVDLESLRRLLGHADFAVIRRYLAQTEDDLRAAHAKGGPVDRLL